MGISISNATSSAITKYSESLRSGEPDWSMIPSAGKSNKSQAEFVSEMYYEFEEPAEKLAGHRILALNRGEKEKFLTVKVQAPEEEIQEQNPIEKPET